MNIIATNAPLTDDRVRDLYGLGPFVDLDRPRASIGFRSWREAAKDHFEKWGEE